MRLSPTFCPIRGRFHQCLVGIAILQFGIALQTPTIYINYPTIVKAIRNCNQDNITLSHHINKANYGHKTVEL